MTPTNPPEARAFDLSQAVHYHYGKFPPNIDKDVTSLLVPLTQATEALARYDEMLKTLTNSEILLGPLLRQEAVISSRMEGTYSTIDELLQIEAEEDEGGTNAPRRHDAVEVHRYSFALRAAQKALQEGAAFTPFLVRSIHSELMRAGRGSHVVAGAFKTKQNYIARARGRQVSFVPISPESLELGLENLFAFANDPEVLPLFKTGLFHVEFEALHPFEDGNGRIGRMLITLMLWQTGLIHQPFFYVSDVLEQNRDAYLDHMRSVSAEDAWGQWLSFFLTSLADQAKLNLEKATQISDLYARVLAELRDDLKSRWYVQAVDFLFEHPVFFNSSFVENAGIPEPTARRFSKELVDKGILKVAWPASGRKSALLSFEPLLRLVR